MSDSDSSDAKSQASGGSASQRTINAVVGAVVLLVILILVNYVFGRVNHRFDLTENGIYTLTDGTKNLFKTDPDTGEALVSDPVTIRFYAITDDAYVSQYYLTRAAGVEDFLKEYEKLGGGLITVKRYNPEPFSDDAESAAFDGLPQGVFDDPENPVYFGAVVECEGRKELLPFMPARPEELLEYDVTRAILRVASEERQKVVVMTSMEIGGGFAGNFGAPPSPPWHLISSLERDYEVEILPSNTPEIPPSTDVLIVLHPYDMTDEGQFAVDQYLLKGGRVLVTVDPLFFAARYMSQGGGNPMMPQPPSGPAPSSDINQLFAAWGIQFDNNLVLADMASQTQLQSGYAPTVLSVPDQAMNADDPVTARLSDLFLITPGAFEIADREGITSTVLVSSSKDSSQLVGTFDADPTQREAVQRLRKNFAPDGKQRALVARLSGSFKSAFPEGLPAAGGAGAPDEGPLFTPGEPGEPVVPADEPETDEPETASEPGSEPSDASDSASEPGPADGDQPKPADKDKDKGKAKADAESDADSSASAPAPDPAPAPADKPADSPPAAEPAAEDGDDAPAAPAAPAPESAPTAETGGPEDDESDPTDPATDAAEGGGAGAAVEVPAGPPSLKVSEREGIVMVFADVDFIHDNFSVQQVPNLQEGRIEVRPVNSNLALFENAVEQLAGGDQLIRVRSRASNHRPFTQLNEILKNTEEKFREPLDKIGTEISRISAEQQSTSANVMQIISRDPQAMASGQVQMTPELEAELLKLQEQEEEMAEQMRDLERQQYEINKDIKSEYERSKNQIILLVTGVLPLGIIIFGIGLAINQRIRTAAQ